MKPALTLTVRYGADVTFHDFNIFVSFSLIVDLSIGESLHVQLLIIYTQSFVDQKPETLFLFSASLETKQCDVFTGTPGSNVKPPKMIQAWSLSSHGSDAYFQSTQFRAKLL